MRYFSNPINRLCRSILLGFMMLLFLVSASSMVAQKRNIDASIAPLIHNSQKSLDNNDTASARLLAQEAVIMAKKLDKYSLIKAQLQLAKVFGAIPNYQNSYKMNWYAYSNAKQNNYTVESIEALYAIGSIFEKFKIWKKAIDYLIIADELLYYTTNYHYRIPVKHSLANCYFGEKNYTEALYYYGELQKFALQHQNYNEEIYAIRGIAYCFEAKHEFENAVQYELMLVPKLKRLRYTNEVLNTYLHIGDLYRSSNNDRKAIDFYQLLLNDFQLTDSLKVVINYSKSDSYSNLKDYDASSIILKDLFENSEIYNYPYWHAKAVNLWVLNPFYNSNFTLAVSRIDSITTNIYKFDDIKLKILLIQTVISVYESVDSLEQALVYSKGLNSLYREREAEKLSKKSQKHRTLEALSFRENQMQMQEVEDKVEQAELENLRIHEKQIKQSYELKLAKETKLKLRIQNRILEEEKENEQLMTKNALLEAEKKDADIKRLLKEEELNAINTQSLLERENQKRLIAEEQSRRLLQNRKYIGAIMLAAIIIFFLILRGFLSHKNNSKKLERKNTQLDRRRIETENTLKKLKETQNQLIESERLASLGQLTAGIAHEIRNPLNFVNNFSSLITELLDEVEELISDIEIEEGELKQELIEVLQLIANNNSKVNKHGNRASQIVSTMLDASSGGIADYEVTDVNQLIMDSAKLAYQGVRGDVPGFNLELTFNMDDKLADVFVIHQDLGRVIINIVNNACHALEDKIEKIKDFDAKISISTKSDNGSFTITIEDNGKGMSDEVLAKVFNPFFTTKSTGKGTGLGLTMTYDIITKVHKGKVSVQSELDKFTRFIIEIPKNLKK